MEAYLIKLSSMKKKTWMVVLTVSVIVCLVLVYMTLQSWKEYRMAKENVEMIERITEEMKEYEEMRMKELESWLNDSVGRLIGDDEMSLTGVRVPVSYGPLPGLRDLPMPR